MALNERGHEVLDDTPIAKAVGFRAPPTMQEMIKRAIQTHLSDAARESGQETFEESDDFDVGDDYDPTSPWELTADQERFIERPAADPPTQTGPAAPVGPGAPPNGISDGTDGDDTDGDPPSVQTVVKKQHKKSGS